MKNTIRNWSSSFCRNKNGRNGAFTDRSEAAISYGGRSHGGLGPRESKTGVLPEKKWAFRHFISSNRIKWMKISLDSFSRRPNDCFPPVMSAKKRRTQSFSRSDASSASSAPAINSSNRKRTQLAWKTVEKKNRWKSGANWPRTRPTPRPADDVRPHRHLKESVFDQ